MVGSFIVDFVVDFVDFFFFWEAFKASKISCASVATTAASSEERLRAKPSSRLWMNWVCPTKASSLRTLYKSVWASFSNSGMFLVTITMDLFVSLRRGFVILVFRFVFRFELQQGVKFSRSGDFGLLS